MKKIIGLFLTLLLSAPGSPALSQDMDMEFHQPPANLFTTVPDLMIVRPFSAMGAFVTSSLFLATLPLTYPMSQDLKFAQTLVERPWTYVSDRPLGVFAPGESIMTQIDSTISKQYQDYFVLVGADRSPLTMK